MPDCDGLELTRKLRQYSEFTDLAIIAMSSVNDMSVRSDFADVGVEDYWVKPIARPDFERMITTVAKRMDERMNRSAPRASAP